MLLALLLGCPPFERVTDPPFGGDSGTTDTGDPFTTAWWPPDDTTDDTGCVASAWYPDADGDGHGATSDPVEACAAPDGFVASGDDCYDDDPAAYPGAAETACDFTDNDCDGVVDNVNDAVPVWYEDNDRDGWGGDYTRTACEQPDGFLPTTGDCDDFDWNTYPGAPETCDEEDDDCDGEIDEDGAVATFYADRDGDGHGDAGDSVTTCPRPEGYVLRLDDDCDDADPDVWPGAPETCDGTDEDCDGDVDERVYWYDDADGDGYGDAATEQAVCPQPDGTVADGTDCDDADATVFPGAGC